MKTGYSNHPRRDVIEEIEWAAANGFDFVDLFLEPDRAAIEHVNPDRIRAVLEKHRLPALGHTACYLPIGSPIADLRGAAVQIAMEYIGVFGRIGVPAVTIHANWPGHMFTEQEGIAWQVESLKCLVAGAADNGTRIMYEPVTTPMDNSANIRKVLSCVPEVLLHLDLGHCNLCGRDPCSMVSEFSGSIFHVHVHDNNGAMDLHLPPGTGNIDWPALVDVLKSTGYDDTLTLEVFSEDRDYLLLAKQKIERLWNE